jgi:hypothetical protein
MRIPLAPSILEIEPKPGGGVVHGPRVLEDEGPIE